MDSTLVYPAAWRRAAVTAAVLGSLIACLAAAMPALATPGHAFSFQFGGGQVGNPVGVAFDEASGEVVVGSYDGGSISVFSSSGDLVRSWGGGGTPAGSLSGPTQVAIGGSSVWVADSNNKAVVRFDLSGNYLGQLDPSGTPAGSFSNPYGVAVDPVNGDVYVGDAGNNVVLRFSSAGAFVETIGAGELAGPEQVAVDSNQDLYVADKNNNRVVKYSGGAAVGTIAANNPTGVAVNLADDHLFVSNAGPFGSQVTEYQPDGTKVSSFGGGLLNLAYGLAIDPATGTAYVADYIGGAVFAFDEALLATVSTSPGATGIGAGEATVAGTVNPEGVAGTTYRFDYGLDQGYGSSTAEVDAGGGTSDVAASGLLTGLAPLATYHFRIVATSPQGTSVGEDQTFTSGPVPAAVDGQPPFASAIATGGATLNGTVNPNGAQTDWHFEYGTDTSYGSSTPATDAGSISPGDASVSAPVEGLQPGTTYHFRVVADNGIGAAAQGADQLFTTAPATPPSASELTAASVLLHGAVNPTGMPATYHFEYGTDTTYGASTPETDAGSGTDDVEVTRRLKNLADATTYHFRVVATINGQTVSSDDATFTTLPAPDVTVDAVTRLTTTTATVGATVDTHGYAGTLAIYVTSLKSTYTTNASVALSAFDGEREITFDLSDLPPGGDYVILPAATAAGVTVYGDQATFSTPGQPTGTLPPPPNITNNPYGCTHPKLNPINTKPKAGQTVTVTGTDLGVAGTIALGDTPVDSTSWATNKVTFKVSAGTTGTKALTVNCGKASNTVALTIAKRPSNKFAIGKATASGLKVTLRIKVPANGRLRTSGRNVKATSKSVRRGTTAKVVVRLTKAGKQALAKRTANTMPVALRIRFTPNGGTTNTKTRTITFKRGGTR